MRPLTEEHIWEILDGEASAEMRAQHEAQLSADESYRTTFVQCEQLHCQLLQMPLESPSMRFTTNLMERLAPAQQTVRKKDRLPLIFATIFSVVSGFFAFLIFFTNKSTATPQQGLTTEGVISYFSNPLFVQSFMLLNLVLFFVVLDKKVLKPYFENREKWGRG
jgi:sterol desaturase/sphingolipid hydroxylase (fatty acid hydroxylase superfamily)